MQDHDRTQEQLINELEEPRLRVSELETVKTLREHEGGLNPSLSNVPSPDDQIEEKEFGDIVDIPQIQSLMDDFYKLTNIGIAILDLKGNVLVANGWQDICTKFHRVHPETRKNCLESDVLLTGNVKEGEYRSYRCKNHMRDMVTPIVIGGTRVGNLYLGQFFFEDEIPEVEVFTQQAQRYGFNQAEYLAALQKVPRWSREKVNTVMTFYSKFASIIGSLRYSNLRLAKTMVEREEAEKALKQSEQMLRTILATAPVGIGVAQDRVMKWANEAWRTMFGFKTEQECMGLSARVLYPSEEEYHRVGAALHHCLEDERVTETDTKLYRQDGSVFDAHIWMKCHDTSVSEKVTIAAIVDISDRKRAEQAIKENQDRLILALRGADLGMWDVDLSTGRVTLNERAFEMFGYAPGEIEPSIDLWQNSLHPDDSSRIGEAFRQSLEGPADFFELEYRARTKSGEYLWILSRGKTVERAESGRPSRMSGTFMDITLAKQAEHALKQKIDELELFNSMMVDRELRMIELKKEINELFKKAGGQEKYRIVE